MIPSSVTGLVVFLASVGPGYVYVRVAERWRPYRERTVLREVAEIVVTGSLATLVGVVVALGAARATDLLPNRESLVDGVGRYLVYHPGRMGLSLLIVIAVSYGLAWLVARYAPGRRTPDGHVTSIDDQFVLLRGEEIRYIAASYRPLTAVGSGVNGS